MDDIIQDYEYYEAHAKDVKLEDITSDQDNRNLLARLRDNNDPELKNFTIVNEGSLIYNGFFVREGDHLGWLGYFVGRSDTLKTLNIYDYLLPDNINKNAFFDGLGHNRSIEMLRINTDLGESFRGLIPFLRNNDSLQELYLIHVDFHMGFQVQGARSIASLLSQNSSLKRFTLDEVDFDHEQFSQITAALRSQSQIEELTVCGYNTDRNCYVALGNALEGCPSLRKLELSTYDEGLLIDGEGLHALIAGLKHCHSLTSLELYGNLMITEEVSRSLSTLFQSDKCRLEVLDLGPVNINDDGMAVLAIGLASIPSLKKLNLYGMSIRDQGLQHLVRGLVNCNLEEMHLSSNMLMDSVSGLRELGILVRTMTNMHTLSLSESLTNEGLQSFVEGMANCCSLTELDLSNNSLITANGLASLSSLLRFEHCSLSHLVLGGINIGDDGAAVLANGLVGNKSLTNLRFDVSRIPARGWATFSRLLCDTLSVNNTYFSNHTLEVVGFGIHDRMEDTPSDILVYSKWNKSHNQAAATCKILLGHPDIDITPLFEFNLKCLPLVVEWLEKAKSYLDEVNESTEVFQCRQFSAVYKFIRGMPLLAVNGFRGQKMKDVQLQLQNRSRKRGRSTRRYEANKISR